ncbi:ATPase [bacterium]|nr:ATPase [bacterium]
MVETAQLTAAPEGATGVGAFFADPTTWAGVGLILFIAVVLWRRVPGQIAKSLDDRSERIADELQNAESLRVEAEKKLVEAEQRRAAADAEARAIIEEARREAAELAVRAREQLAETISRRERMAEERIARAELDATRDVRMAAVDAASKAAAALITDKMTGAALETQFDASLDAVRKALTR